MTKGLERYMRTSCSHCWLQVMQVRRGQFGRSGRSKWTHLVNEDTTSWDTPWNMNDPLRTKCACTFQIGAPVVCIEFSCTGLSACNKALRFGGVKCAPAHPA